MKKSHWLGVLVLLLLAAVAAWWQGSGRGVQDEGRDTSERRERDAREQRLSDRADISYWLEDYTSSGEYTRPRMKEDFAGLVGRSLLRHPEEFFALLDEQDGIPGKAELSDEALAYLAQGATAKALALLKDRPYLWRLASNDTKNLLIENALKYAQEEGMKEALDQLPESVAFEIHSRIASRMAFQIQNARNFTHPPEDFLYGAYGVDSQILISSVSQGALPEDSAGLRNWLDYTTKRELASAESQLLRQFGKMQAEQTLQMLAEGEDFTDKQTANLLLGVSINKPEQAVAWSLAHAKKHSTSLYERWLREDPGAASGWLLEESEARQKQLGKTLIKWAERNGDEEGAKEWRKILMGSSESSE